jgi:hypothetical protein
MNIAHQPGSQPLEIPEQIPNPAVRPVAPPNPERRPDRKEPVKVPEEAPANRVPAWPAPPRRTLNFYVPPAYTSNGNDLPRGNAS